MWGRGGGGWGRGTGEGRGLSPSHLHPQGATGFPGAAGRVGPPGPNVSWGELGSLGGTRVTGGSQDRLGRSGIAQDSWDHWGKTGISWNSWDPLGRARISRDSRDQPGSLTPSFGGSPRCPQSKATPGCQHPLLPKGHSQCSPIPEQRQDWDWEWDQGWIRTMETPPQFPLTSISPAG